MTALTHTRLHAAPALPEARAVLRSFIQEAWSSAEAPPPPRRRIFMNGSVGIKAGDANAARANEHPRFHDANGTRASESLDARHTRARAHTQGLIDVVYTKH